MLINVTTEDKNGDSEIYSFITERNTPIDSYSLGSLTKGSSRDEKLNVLGSPNKDSGDILQCFNREGSTKQSRILIQLDENSELINLTYADYFD